MGIFQKLSTLIRSNINDLIARAENPEKMLNQIILDMREQLAKAKREVAAAIADERKLRAKLEEEANQAGEWEQRARLAIGEGRDDLAKQALTRQQEHSQRAASLERTWRAQAQRRIHETMSGLSDTSAFEAFDRMAEKIEESERRSIAAAEVDESLTGDTLEQKFQQLEAGGESEDVSNRLLALKKEMGFLPAGEEEEEAKQLGAGDVQEADIESVEEDDEEAEAEAEEEEVPEAQLIEEFERLGRNTDGSR